MATDAPNKARNAIGELTAEPGDDDTYSTKTTLTEFPELLDANRVAEALGLKNRGSVYRAKLPGEVRIGGRRRWRGDSLRAWVLAGCPGNVDAWYAGYVARECEGLGLEPAA